jgi:hypothetical protein
VKYDDILATLAELKELKEIQVSNCIKLDEGTSVIKYGAYEKKETLLHLSEHKHLKAGCISIVSSNKKKPSQR